MYNSYMISLQVCENREEWDNYVIENDGHPLQLWGWGETKAAHGWYVERLFGLDLDKKPVGAAQVLVKRLPWPFKALAYIPRGPVVGVDHTVDFLEALTNYAKTRFGAVALSIEPDWMELPELPKGWQKSDNTILIPQTLVLDLTKSEEGLLAPMAKKTRQYIRKSDSEEHLAIQQIKGKEYFEACLDIYHETARRAGFAIHDDTYYRDVFNNLGEASPVFAAFHEGRPVAFLWLAISASTAFELYGGVTDRGQELRANYALKWYAVRKAKEWGIEKYDMNGLLNDGVSNFKRGFANHEDQLVGTYERPLSPLYLVWTKALPVSKKIIQKIRRR